MVHAGGQDNDPKGISVIIRWMSQTRLVKTLARFRDLVGLVAFFSLGAWGVWAYFAPVSELKKIECALERQRASTIKRDTRSEILRQIASVNDQENLVVDMLLLLSVEAEDSVSVKNLKNKLRKLLDEKLKSIREFEHALRKQDLVVQGEIGAIDMEYAKKKCD